MTDRTRAIGLLVIAVIFLAFTISTWFYGSGIHRYIDAMLAGISTLGYFFLSLYFYRKWRKGKI